MMIRKISLLYCTLYFSLPLVSAESKYANFVPMSRLELELIQGQPVPSDELRAWVERHPVASYHAAMTRRPAFTNYCREVVPDSAGQYTRAMIDGKIRNWSLAQKDQDQVVRVSQNDPEHLPALMQAQRRSLNIAPSRGRMFHIYRDPEMLCDVINRALREKDINALIALQNTYPSAIHEMPPLWLVDRSFCYEDVDPPQKLVQHNLELVAKAPRYAAQKAYSRRDVQKLSAVLKRHPDVIEYVPIEDGDVQCLAERVVGQQGDCMNLLDDRDRLWCCKFDQLSDQDKGMLQVVRLLLEKRRNDETWGHIPSAVEVLIKKFAGLLEEDETGTVRS